MDLSNVKLVVTDLDGTLLNSNHEVSNHFFELFHNLKNHVHFVAASGRQYHSMSAKFESILNDITIVAENGGLTMQGDKELLFTDLSIEKTRELIPLIRELNGGYAVLCGKECAYVETENQDFISLFDEYYNKYKIVKDLSKVTNDPILKIAIYHFESSEKYLFPALKHLEGEMKIKVSGQNWLDISHVNANKGFALKQLQQKMGISPKETMVFGDYNNDLEMLELADYSFAMENAHPDVKKVANYSTKSNEDYGVEVVLEQLYKAKQNR